MSTLPPHPTRRLFHEDALLTEFEAELLEARPVPTDPPAIEVRLDRTAFYATSGGQPHDTGRLGGWLVVDVRDEDGHLWHRVVPDALAGPTPALEPGTTVAGLVDAERRRDHMQQHTGQHILSQAFIEIRSAETVSFHLGVESVTIDLARADLSLEDLRRAERRANDVVMDDRPVRIHWTTREEVHRFPLRKPPTVDGAIRVVEVEGYDWSACGGTHVASTGRIGLIKLLTTGAVKQGTRVEFRCGHRALEDYAWKHALVREVAARFSTLDRNVGESIARLEEEHREARRRIRELEEERLDREADELLAVAAADPAGRRLLVLERPGRSMEELKALALRLRARPHVIAFLAAPSPMGGASLVFARSEDRTEDMARALKAALGTAGGKGGGRPELAQGQVGTPANLDAMWRAARESIDAP